MSASVHQPTTKKRPPQAGDVHPVAVTVKAEEESDEVTGASSRPIAGTSKRARPVGFIPSVPASVKTEATEGGGYPGGGFVLGVGVGVGGGSRDRSGRVDLDGGCRCWLKVRRERVGWWLCLWWWQSRFVFCVYICLHLSPCILV